MKLSTTLIVKDELENLKSLIPILKQFSDEIVVVDTGSKDGTLEFLSLDKEIVLKQIKWEYNFSKARNYSLSLATKDFILWIDADDRITEENIEKLNLIKSKLNSKKLYFIKLLNQADSTISYQLRIFPNNRDIHFKYPVHEQITYPEQIYQIEFTNIEIVHIGYNNREDLEKKQVRNLKILENIEKKDYYINLQIAESYKILKKYINALKFFKKALNDPEIAEKNRELVGYILSEIYTILNLIGQESEAYSYLKIADDFSEFFPVIKYLLGKAFYKKNQLDKALSYFNEFLILHKNKIYFNPVPLKLEDSALYFIAKINIKMNNLETAKNILKYLLKKYPENKSYLRELKNATK